MDRDKFVSLADVLGIDPEAAVGKTAAEIERNLPRKASSAKRQAIKAFCRDILASPEYKEHLYRLIVRDALPPAIEQLLFYYAEGKPVEKLEVKETTKQLEDLSVEQLEARISHLHETVKSLRKAEVIDEESEDSGPTSSVH